MKQSQTNKLISLSCYYSLGVREEKYRQVLKTCHKENHSAGGGVGWKSYFKEFITEMYSKECGGTCR